MTNDLISTLRAIFDLFMRVMSIADVQNIGNPDSIHRTLCRNKLNEINPPLVTHPK